MIFSVPHKICEDVWVLGRKEFPSFLIKTSNATFLIEPELSCNLKLIEEQLKDIGLSIKTIDCCIVLHEHYDHFMMVPPLKNKHPEIKIYIPSGAEKVLQGKTLLAYKLFDDFTCEKLELASEELEWSNSYEVYNENTHLDDISFIHTPGHSPFSYSAIFREIVFTSDALGFWGKRFNFPLYFQDFNLYIESIEKLKSLSPQTIIMGHFSYFQKEEAANILDKSIKLAENTREKLKNEEFNETNVEKLFKLIYRDEFLAYPEDVIKSVAKYILKRSKEV